MIRSFISLLCAGSVDATFTEYYSPIEVAIQSPWCTFSCIWTVDAIRNDADAVTFLLKQIILIASFLHLPIVVNTTVDDVPYIVEKHEDADVQQEGPTARQISEH